MRKRVFKTFAAAALATTIAGTTIIGSTAFADEISTLTQQKQDKQNELDQLQQQAAYLLTEMSSLEQDMQISQMRLTRLTLILKLHNSYSRNSLMILN